MASNRSPSCRSLLVCMIMFVLSCPASLPAAALSLSVTGGGALSTFTDSQTVMLTASLKDDAGRTVSLDGEQVRWSAVSSHVRSKAWARPADRWNGLCWGGNALSLSEPEEDRLRMAGAAPVGPTASLTDIVGERDVTVQASVTLKKTGATHTATARVVFGKGPLSVFAGAPLKVGTTWKEAVSRCGGKDNPDVETYQPGTRLPSREQLQAVSGAGKGAAFAAGWPQNPPWPPRQGPIPGAAIPLPRDSDIPPGSEGPYFIYWTGEAEKVRVFARVVYLQSGSAGRYPAAAPIGIAVCLP